MLDVLCFTWAGNQVLLADGRTAAERGSAGSQETHPPQAVEQRLQKGLQPLSLQPVSTQKALHKAKTLPILPQNVLATQEDLGRPRQRAPPCDSCVVTFFSLPDAAGGCPDAWWIDLE